MYSSRIRRTMQDRYPDQSMSKASAVHDCGTAPRGDPSSGFQCSAQPDEVAPATGVDASSRRLNATMALNAAGATAKAAFANGAPPDERTTEASSWPFTR